MEKGIRKVVSSGLRGEIFSLRGLCGPRPSFEFLA